MNEGTAHIDFEELADRIEALGENKYNNGDEEYADRAYEAAQALRELVEVARERGELS